MRSCFPKARRARERRLRGHRCPVPRRAFDAQPLTTSERSRVEELLQGSQDVPFGNRVALSRCSTPPPPRAARPAGNLRRHPRGPGLVAGAVREGARAREDYGYALEGIVLLLTAMGLGTCWLAGAWRRGGFAERFALEADEISPAVTPIGRPAARRSPIDAVFRAGARSSRRLPWERLFTVSREEAGRWAACLDAVRQGPSATNGQPWRIAKEPGRPVFHLGLAGPAPRRSVRRLDAGIAMCHFAVVAAELGLAGAWTAPKAAEGEPHPLLPPARCTWRAGFRRDNSRILSYDRTCPCGESWYRAVQARRRNVPRRRNV